MVDGAPRHLALVLMLGMCCATMPACKLVKKWFAPAEAVELGEARASPPPASSDRDGLGVRLLVVDDTDYDAPRALRAYPALSDEGVGQRWDRWGFRVVEVPLGDVDAFLEGLRPVQPVSIRFMGEFGGWRALVRSGAIGEQPVAVGGTTRTVGPGRPRLMARSWAEPVLSDRGVSRELRVDLGIQIEAPPSKEFELIPERREPTLDDAGLVIDDLLCTLRLDGDHALVIVGEVPGESWDELPEPAQLARELERWDALGPGEEADEEADEADDLRSPPKPFSEPMRGRRAIAPEVPRTRSLGELMLVAPGSRVIRSGVSRTIPKRVVIVLTPSLNEPLPPHLSAEGGSG